MRIAAVADLHIMEETPGLARALLDHVEREADVLLLGGDLTHWGKPKEMDVLLSDLRSIPLPTLAVLGNHDHQDDQVEALSRLLREAGVRLLDGSSAVIAGIGFAGVKGFCGGFDPHKAQPFGERELHRFVRIGMEEAERLDRALRALPTQRKIALLHYSPIRATLEGESPELYPFLGTSRLEEVLDRNGVEIAFHGHAHHGAPSGRTKGGIPVRNVARFVQSRVGPRDYFLHEVG